MENVKVEFINLIRQVLLLFTIEDIRLRNTTNEDRMNRLLKKVRDKVLKDHLRKREPK